MRTEIARPMVSGMVLPMANQDRAPFSGIFDFRLPVTGLPARLTKLGATYTRNSAKTVVQNGALVTLSANQFGTSYDPVTGLYGYVPEPAATNLCTYSEQVGSAPWASTSVSISANSAVAPDGNTTADSLVESAVTDYHFTRRPSLSVSSGVSYTGSVFAKYNGCRYLQVGFGGAIFSGAGGRRAIFDLQGGTVTLTESGASASIVYIGNGWYRLSVTITPTSASTAAFFDLLLSNTASVLDSRYLGNGTSGVFVWGVQIETGSRATSYIPTGASTASRAGDVLSVPLANIPGFNPAGYTLFADCRMDVAGTDTARGLASVYQNSSDRSYLYVSPTPRYANYCSVGGVPQANIDQTATTTNRSRFAAVFAGNGFIRALDGTAGASDISGSVPLGVTTLAIGANHAGEQQFNGYIYRIGLIPRALTQAQINGLTTL